MNTFSHVPPGFRFHPTDEELVDYYLRKKIAARKIDLDVIKDVDLYKIEPWDLQELCKIGSEGQQDWYFFSHKDKKYPTGTRTNRATKAGFWKATGRDKAIYSKHCLIGMRKTLVFYKGRAPNGQKSDWIMHEYRLETSENGAPQEEGWVVCRVFKKRMTTVRRMEDDYSPYCYDDQVSFIPDFESPRRISLHQNYQNTPNNYNHHIMNNHHCKQELEIANYNNALHDPYYQLPQLESPKVAQVTITCTSIAPYETNTVSSLAQSQPLDQSMYGYSNLSGERQGVDQTTDWRVLDKFVASQLSHEEHAHPHHSKGPNYSNAPTFPVSEHMIMGISPQQDAGIGSEHVSTSTSSCHIDLWK